MNRIKKYAKICWVVFMALLIVLPAYMNPVKVGAARTGLSMIHTGNAHSIALLDDGTVWAWGINVRGQLGDGTRQNSAIPVQLDLTDVVDVAVGWAHTLALKEDGTVWSWGPNEIGRLGDGTVNDRSAPVQVSGLTDVIAIDAGYGHSIALKDDGTVWTWGRNNYGQLGNGSDPNTNSLTPVQVSDLTDVVAIAAGDDLNYAIKSDGTVWGWGRNHGGFLGDGTSENQFSPVRISDLIMTEEDTIVPGGFVNHVVKSDGTVWGWGSGILGDGSYSSDIPKPIPTLTNVVAMSTGFGHSLVLKSDGTVWAFGSNDTGQLGIGNNEEQIVPVQVNGLTDVAAIEANGKHSFAVRFDGTVWGWGDNNFGQLGDGTNTDTLTPVQVQFTLDSMDASLSALSLSESVLEPAFDPNTRDYYAEVAPNVDRVSVMATASNPSATVSGTGLVNLHEGMNDIQVTVTAKDGFHTAVYEISVYRASVSDVKAIAAGQAHSLVLQADGTLWTTGSNSSGQLGDGTTENRNKLKPVLSDVSAIAAGGFHSLAIKKDGTLWAWGHNEDGQLGDGTSDNRVIPIQVMDGVSAVAAGEYHSMALKNDGTVWTWGRNANGQLGDGTDTSNNVPVQVLDDVSLIAAGNFHSFAIKNDGTLWGWGLNGNRQLGDGTTTNSYVPKQLLEGAIAVAAGFGHSMAVKEDGTLWIWGDNSYGQLGDGTWASSSVPKQLLEGAIAVAAGKYHSVALKQDGTVWAWGLNMNGQVGDGSPFDQVNTPKQVMSEVSAIKSGGGNHSLAIKDDRTLWVWGFNGDGELGTGTYSSSKTPTQVELAFLVSYESNGGSAVPEQLWRVGEVVVEPAEPERNGYTFDGWYEDAEWTMPYDFDQPLMRDLTLYAKWLSGNTGIGTLTLDGVTLQEAVSADVFQYTANVENEIDETRVQVTPLDDNATISAVRVNGQLATNPIPLNVGATVIEVEITAEDGVSKQTYTITVTREGSANAMLRNLTVDYGPLHPVFDPAHYVYTIVVPYTVDSVSVTAEVYHDQAKLELSGEVRASGDPLHVPLIVGDNLVTVEVQAENEIDTATYVLTVTRQDRPFVPSQTRSTADDERSDDAATDDTLKLHINGVSLEGIVTSVKTMEGSRSAVRVSVDASRLAEALDGVQSGTLVFVQVEEEVDEVSVALTGDAVKAIANSQSVLVVATSNGTYYLPAAELFIDRLSEQLEQASLPEIVVQVDIMKSSEAKVQQLEDTAKASGFAIVATPVDFNVTASHNGMTMEVTTFSGYVNREIPVPSGVNPDEVSTAVIQDEDGSVRHVPTSVEVRDGKAVAQIRSLTNSTYALVRHAATFTDVDHHWAEQAIHDLASRMIVSGQAAGRYVPDAAVTRAEFAAIAVRALGLPAGHGAAGFTDVKSGDWFAGAVATAKAYGLLSGYEDGSFRPASTITRQEAVVIMARMMQLAELDASITDPEADALLSGYTDGAEVAAWAKAAVAAAIQHELMVGSNGKLHLKSEITRAEATVIMQRLLQRAELID